MLISGGVVLFCLATSFNSDEFDAGKISLFLLMKRPSVNPGREVMNAAEMYDSGGKCTDWISPHGTGIQVMPITNYTENSCVPVPQDNHRQRSQACPVLAESCGLPK